MNSFLQTMCDTSHARMWQAKSVKPLDAVVCEALAMPKMGALRPNTEGFDLIAEIKKASPSQGELSQESETDLIQRAVGYAEAGAVAVSVLTEPERFGGDMEHLRAIAAELRPLGVPAMRKDFIVDVYQVWQAAAAGAGGVLLILRILDDHIIMDMLEAAAQARMFVLLEAFDERDLQRAVPFVSVNKRVLVGLNARNLDTQEVENQRLITLANRFPPNCLRVAESGLSEAKDAAAVAKAGYQLALVGSALMRDKNPKDLVAKMLVAGREATQW